MANLLGRHIGVVTSEQALSSGTVCVRVEVDVPSPGRALVTMAVNGMRGARVALAGANPVSYDVRGRGLRIGSGVAGIWPSYAPSLDFTGGIIEVRITLRGEGTAPNPVAKARAAMTEQ